MTRGYTAVMEKGKHPPARGLKPEKKAQAKIRGKIVIINAPANPYDPIDPAYTKPNVSDVA